MSSFVRPLAEAAALVRELFAPAEQAALRAAQQTGTGADYWPLFFTIWTRKEAYAKLLGRGVGMPFSTFAVLTPGAGGRPVLTALAGATLHGVELSGGYRAALATGAAAPPPRCFCYPAG